MKDRYNRNHIDSLIKKLKEIYPDAHCELDYSNPLELLIATMLSAQCTDVQVNIVTKDLFQRFQTARDYCECSLEQMEMAISRIGLFRNKAKNIQACCRILVERHGGAVPDSMEELVELPGVGRKTANVVLGNAFAKNEGVVVDTHVARLSARLGLTHEKQPERIEKVLMTLIPRDQWNLFSHWIIWHGRRRCKARNPDCAGCELRKLCPSVDACES